MSKTLVICGDSYMSPVSAPEYGHGEHFSEILAKKLNVNLISLARGACSNQVIRLQIDEAIKYSPDLIIVSNTTQDRMEFPIFGKEYNSKKGLSNIKYSDWCDISSQNEIFKNNEPSLYSETLNNIFSLTDPNFSNIDKSNQITEQQKEDIKNYFLSCYDSHWKMQLDIWVLRDGIRKIMDHKIPFYFCAWKTEDFSFCQNNLALGELNPCNYQNDNAHARFHISIENSYKLANLWYEKIITDGYL